MIRLARELSNGYPFLSVDLYEVNQQTYFSELTFTPCGGMMPFQPAEWDKIFGDMLILPEKQ